MTSSRRIIAPSILSADFGSLSSEMRRLEENGADWIHVDVMDGHFVDNLTIGPPVVRALKKAANLPLDVHLMISNPEKYLRQFIDAGADCLTLHVETIQAPESAFKFIASHNVKTGITLRPSTSLDKILPYIHLVDMVLVMTVEPGFGGQKFMNDQVEKINKLVELRDPRHNFLIEVDGGINKETIKNVPGADVIVAGSYIFSASDMKSAIDSLRVR